MVDRLGTRRGLTSRCCGIPAAAMATSMAVGFKAFARFRFALGLGEAANWPGATKAVSEWFPRRGAAGRGLSTAVVDRRRAGAVHRARSLQYIRHLASCLSDHGTLGLLGWCSFLWLYRRRGASAPLRRGARRHSRESRGFRELTPVARRPSYRTARCCGCLRQGLCPLQSFNGSVWFFITDWLRFTWWPAGSGWKRALPGSGCRFSPPTLGNFFGGGLASTLIARDGMSGGTEAIAVFGGIGMTMLIPAVWTDSFVRSWRASRNRDLCVRGVLDGDPEPAQTSIRRIGRERQRARRKGRVDLARLPPSTPRMGERIATRSAPILIGASVLRSSYGGHGAADSETKKHGTGC